MSVTLLISAGIGLVCGPVIFWASRWMPHQMERQEADWIAHMANVRPEPKFPSAALRSSAFWIESLRLPAFWITVAIAPLLCLAFAIRFDGAPFLGCMVFFGLAMYCMAVTDHYSQYLPDVMTLATLWLGLLAQLTPATQTVGLEAAVIGAAAGYLVLWGIAQLFLMVRKQEGLGHGDMKLMAAVGAWLGPLALPGVILIGSVLALIVQGAKLLQGKSGRHDLFAFGPWLAIGGIISALFLA